VGYYRHLDVVADMMEDDSMTAPAVRSI